MFVKNISAIGVSISICEFKRGDLNYIELYSKFKSNSLQWASRPDDMLHLYSQMEMLCLISKSEELVIAEKYNIQSPELDSPSDYWDMRRFLLEQGSYNITLKFVDLNNVSDTMTFEQNINISLSDSSAQFSDILLLESIDRPESKLAFQRMDFSYEPLEFNLLNAATNEFIFYTELYNLNQQFDELMFVKYFVENEEADGFDKYSKTGYKKIKPDSLNRLLISFSAKELVSGNYILHLELNEKSKKRISSKQIHFSVYNPVEDYKIRYTPDASFESSFFQYFTEDELNYSLKAIFPRVGNNMTEILNYIIRNKELKPKKYFLYNFWSSFSIDKMQENYDAYMAVARAVDNSYTTNVFFGFETDRGRIFMKYGKPDDTVFEEDEQTAPPYEIWIYNYIEETQQTNVKFLFYNPSLATNDFILLHSNCRGEQNNPRWELDLYSDAYIEQPNNYIDGRQMPDNFNRNARRYFNDF